MASEDRDRPTGDEELTAYLDGELAPDRRAALEQRLAAEPALRQRLGRLDRGRRPFREAFDVLLQDAPTERLKAMLDAAASTPRGRRSWRAASMAAAAAVLFIAGIGVGKLMAPLLWPPAQQIAEQAPDRAEDWREAVAGYMSLYTSETLANLPDDAALKERELAAVTGKLGLSLSLDRIDLPNLQFKRAQLFGYDGKPLAQLAYVDPEFGPVAFCIMADGEESEAQRTEQRLGMNIVYWAGRGYYFMLIGRAPEDRLRPLADALAARFSS